LLSSNFSTATQSLKFVIFFIDSVFYRVAENLPNQVVGERRREFTPILAKIYQIWRGNKQVVKEDCIAKSRLLLGLEG